MNAYLGLFDAPWYRDWTVWLSLCGFAGGLSILLVNLTQKALPNTNPIPGSITALVLLPLVGFLPASYRRVVRKKAQERDDASTAAPVAEGGGEQLPAKDAGIAAPVAEGEGAQLPAQGADTPTELAEKLSQPDAVDAKQPPFVACEPEGTFVFVSYSHSDSDKVYTELLRFAGTGVPIWYDEGIDPGNEWPDEVAAALDAASLLIVLMTPRAATSRNVNNEINFAIRRSKPVIAIHLEETLLPRALELQLGSIEAVFKWRMDDASYERKLRRILKPVLGQDPA